MATFKLSKSSKANLKDVRRNLKLLTGRVLKKSEHDFGIPQYGGLRTPQEQNNLFHKRIKVIKSDGTIVFKKVTWLDGFRRLSYHQSGNAVDIFLYDEHGACWDYENCLYKYKEITDLFKIEFELMKERGLFEPNETIVCGVDWKYSRIDPPHIEIRY